MGERSILSYFKSSNDAQAARDQLLALGVEVAQIDRVGRFGSETGDVIRNPTTGDITSQANMILNTDARDDTAILLSADPSVSGLSGEMVDGYSFLLTAITDDEHVDQAVQVIKSHKGYV